MSHNMHNRLGLVAVVFLFAFSTVSAAPRPDMVAKVKDFYAKYYGYELTDDEAAKILANEEPEAEKADEEKAA